MDRERGMEMRRMRRRMEEKENEMRRIELR